MRVFNFSCPYKKNSQKMMKCMPTYLESRSSLLCLIFLLCYCITVIIILEASGLLFFPKCFYFKVDGKVRFECYNQYFQVY